MGRGCGGHAAVCAALVCAYVATAAGSSAMMITVTSPTFREGGMIPSAHTCDGRDSSPPLEWSGIPAGTKALALVCDDPDAPAGTWVHWVLYNIPADRRSLPGGQPTAETLAGGAGQGVNDFGRFGYGGPCPPSGTHRYYFKLYALDARLDLAGRVTKAALLDAMKGHVLADGALMGRYARRRG